MDPAANGAAFPLASFLVDARGRVLSWNPVCEHLCGYTQAQVRGRALATLFEPAVAPDAELDGAGRLLLRADGTRIPVRVSTAAQSQDGAEPGVSCVIVGPAADAVTARGSAIAALPFSRILNDLPCLFYVIDSAGHLLIWNARLQQALGMPERQAGGIEVLNFFDERDRPAVREAIARAFADGHSSHEAMLIGRERCTPYLFNCSRMELDDKPCLFGFGLDISELREKETRLQVYERAIHASVNGVVITRCESGGCPIEYVNPAFEAITGYTSAESIGRDPGFMRAGMLDLGERRRIRDAVHARRSVHAVLRNQRKDGSVFWNDLRIDPVAGPDGETGHFVGVIMDVTEAKDYARRLEHLANHDALTGLANRVLLQDRLEIAIAMAERTQRMVALAFLDLDNFKFINDSLGHDAGDAVLKEIADRLCHCVREGDTVARMGGDEFVLVLGNESNIDQVVHVIERVRQSLAQPIVFNGKELVAGGSIGVSLYPHDGRDAEQMVRAADAAMYHAKSMGKNNYQFYSEELYRAAHENLLLEASLRRGIHAGELFVLYQPKIDLRSGRIVGAEALVRWRHPTQGVILPDRFIPMAEDTGLTVPLGEWVLAQACAVIRQVRAAGNEGFTISVNLSARQLAQRDLVERLAALIEEAALPRGALELEVTESQLMDNPEEAVRTLTRIKELGVGLAIDDFGTGYSSLSYLQKFPVDVIKIDKALVRDVCAEGADAVIARAVIALGHNLNMKVVAEGVETGAQMAFLRANDCDQVQGYYFSMALPPESLGALLRGG
jgi:diguanylate cyclase (GGDEF)-like protein/PAS domain S-box-containing protein